MKRHFQRAFTLIELLVVIAIIAILAAILFPVFAQAKATAKITTTISGMKQLALGVQMYSGDFDDMAVFEYGYADGSIPGDTNAYHYNTTWVGRIFPYVKNQGIFFDKTMAEITNYNQLYQDPYFPDPFYTYTWAWITSFSLNTDGYSRQVYTGPSCTSYGTDTSQVRSLTAIEEPASRLALTPTRYGTIPNWSGRALLPTMLHGQLWMHTRTVLIGSNSFMMRESSMARDSWEDLLMVMRRSMGTRNSSRYT